LWTSRSTGTREARLSPFAVRLSLDGLEVASAALTGTLDAASASLGIGANPSGTEYFPGTLDDVALFRTALSAAAILGHYRAGSGAASSDANLTSATEYDSLGRPVRTVDPRGTVTRSDYDRLGRPTAVTANYLDGASSGATAADDVRSTFAYDAAGALTGFCPAVQVRIGGCDPASPSETQAWRYETDAGGRQVSQVAPLNAGTPLDATVWRYDAGGRLLSTLSCTTLACTTVHRHTDTGTADYDGVGRLLRSTMYAGAGTGTPRLRSESDYEPNGSVKTSRAYVDVGGVLTNSDTVGATYDTAGRLATLARGGTTLSAFTYTPDGSIASRTDGDAGALGTSAFTWDWAGRLASADLPAGWQDGSSVASYAYGLDGMAASRTWNGGAALAFAYDAAKRPTQTTKTVGASSITFTQAYDRTGNVTSEGRSFRR
jgi:YD repeat-containing protein